MSASDVRLGKFLVLREQRSIYLSSIFYTYLSLTLSLGFNAEHEVDWTDRQEGLVEEAGKLNFRGKCN